MQAIVSFLKHCLYLWGGFVKGKRENVVQMREPISSFLAFPAELSAVPWHACQGYQNPMVNRHRGRRQLGLMQSLGLDLAGMHMQQPWASGIS